MGDVVSSLGAHRESGVIYAAAPWTVDSLAMVHDPRSVVGAPRELAAVVDAELARESLRAWSSWQVSRPDMKGRVDALLGFVVRRLTQVHAAVPALARHRATTQSGSSYDDPSDDLLYLLFLQMEAGHELFLVVQRLDDDTGHTYVRAQRDDYGAYLLEQGVGGPGRWLGTVKPSMPWAYVAVCDRMRLSSHVTGSVRPTVDLAQSA